MKPNTLRQRAASLFVVFVLCLCALPSHVFAVEDPNIQAVSAYMADPDTGMVLYQKNAEARRYPASTTKIMTALLTLEHANLNDTVTATSADFTGITSDASNAGIKVGETMTVHDLLYCLMLPSANEAAMMLARHVGGSVDNFVKMMNDKAKKLGCTGTHFANPNGLQDPNHYTTAHDLYRIASAAMQNQTFAEIANTAQKTLQATNMHPARKIFTTNALTLRRTDPSYYAFCKGIKTGHTDEAGYCLVGYAEKGDGHLLSVLLGCTQPQGRTALSFTETKRLFIWGFSNFTTKEIVKANETVTEIPVRLSTSADSVLLKTSAPLTALVPRDLDTKALKRKITTPQAQNAPIHQGQVIGHMTVSANGVTYGSVDLVAASDISVSKVLYYADKLENFFRSGLFKVAVIVLIVLFFGTIAYRLIRMEQRRRRRQQSIRDRYRTYK